MEKKTLWTKNYITIQLATVFGAVGGIAGSLALSFLVFEETESTLAAALVVALRIIPGFLVPLMFSPMLDRLPRKPFLVGCDAGCSVIYLIAGLWLRSHEFSYPAYLGFSLLIAAMGSFDMLTYDAVFAKTIPEGFEEKGYSFSSLLYPALNLLVGPLAAVLYEKTGVAYILIGQSVLSMLAAVTESTVKIDEEIREGTDMSLKQWWGDIKEAAAYMKEEKGLLSMTLYSATANGMFSGYEPTFVAFFSSAPGLTLAMYSLFTVAEFIGRTVGGALVYKREMPPEKKCGFAFFVYFFYDAMDAVLLWLPYPLMLVNRCISGFLGIQSGTLRSAAIQRYIPDEMRARVSAYQNILFEAFAAVLSLFVGALGEVMDYRLVMTVCGLICICTCLLTNVRNRKAVDRVFRVVRNGEEG